MAQAIIVKNSFIDQQKIEDFLHQELKFEIISQDTIKDALNFLDIMPEVTIIFLPEKDRLKMSAERELTDFFKKRASKAFIFVTTFQDKNSENNLSSLISRQLKYLAYNAEVEVLKKEIRECLNLREENAIAISHFSIPLSMIDNLIRLEGINVFPFNLSFGIKRSNEELQYILRFRKLQPLSAEEIHRYKEQGVKNFYISYEEQTSFEDFTTNIRRRFQTKHNDTFEGKIYNAEMTLSILKQHFSTFGIDDSTEKMMDSYFEKSTSLLKEDSSLQLLIKNFHQNNSSYQYVHSLVLTIILTKVGQRLGWDSQNFKDKITFLCLLHDILLVDDELAKINTQEQLEKSLLSDAQKDLIINHAFKVSILAKELKQHSLGLDEILKEHHGMKSGIGFNDQQNLHIQHLSMVFMTCEYFVGELLEIEKPTKNAIQEVVQRMSFKFNKSYYQKALQALLEIFK